MRENYIVEHLDQELLAKAFPSVTRWNRLEGRPRTHHFEQALRAEVRDALWFLTRQWQFGEFEGDDAGSPVLARACVDLRTLDRYRPAEGDVHAFQADDVVEARVERKPVPWRAGAQYLSLDLRMAAGRRWLRLLERERAAGRLARDHREAYRGRYAVKVPNPLAPADAQVCAHPDAWQQAGCAAGRAMDGVALLEHLDGGGAVGDGIAATGDEPALEALVARLRAWLTGLVDQPAEGDDAWLPSRLEYAFELSAQTGAEGADGLGGDEAVLRASEYHHGHLDWYALEVSAKDTVGDPQPSAPVDRRAQTIVPTSVVFEGMPNPRWWSFEDRRTNFGQVTPDTVDLGTLLLMEFALTWSNDWFVVPWVLPTGVLAQVQGVAVTTVFDERIWVTPVADATPTAGWAQWSMFALTPEDGVGADRRAMARLALLPTAPKVQEGDALEDVALVRDEQANMVWAVERQVPLPTGWPRPGGEAARELLAQIRRLAPPAPDPAPPVAPIRYQAMSQVPEQWIPFVAVHVNGSTRETQLQRAALPRFVAGQPPAKVRPRTPLLRQNLPAKYLLHEEEVPRAGVVVSHCYQRTRRADGSVVTWYGARKTTGRGEGSSGLAFDQLVNPPTPTT